MGRFGRNRLITLTPYPLSLLHKHRKERGNRILEVHVAHAAAWHSRGGFLFCWLVLCPSWFYTATGERWTPRPYAEAVAGVAQSFGLALLPWSVFAGFLLGRKWWLIVPFALVQGWIAFVSMFMTAGCVTGAWL